MTYILEMQELTKVFPGVLARDKVSMRVERGEIHAICGENGAGKTTLMRILATLSEPTTGMVEINGIDIKRKKEIRKIIKAFFIRNSNDVWYNILDKVADNKNETFNSTVKNSPNSIWSPDKQEIPRACHSRRNI